MLILVLTICSCAPITPPGTDEDCGEGYHTFIEFESDGNATCLSDGTKTATCEDCSKTMTVTDLGSALGHNYVGGKCTRCETPDPSYDGTEENPCSSGHSYTNGTCTVCGAKDPSASSQPTEGVHVGKGYIITANNKNGPLYFSGTVTGGRFDASTDKLFATTVYMEEADGGFRIYLIKSSARNYIVMDDSSTGGNITTTRSEATVFKWNSSIKTLVVVAEANNRAFGIGASSTYSNFSPYDSSNKDYNWGRFVEVSSTAPDVPAAPEVPDTPEDIPSGSAIVINGQTIPYYNGSADYVIVNGNKPFFTSGELKTTAWWSYSPLDSLGRTTGAFACVCRATMPNDDRDSISHLKPTGWKQASYSGVVTDLYNRSHLLAHAFMSDDVHMENLITGTAHMNQKTMQIFETQVLNAVKSGDYIMYRVTPVYEGNNLVCTGVLMEAYSTNDGGDSIEFCVFVYNVQPGVVIDYRTGSSKLGDPTKIHASNTGTSVVIGKKSQ